MTMTGSTADTGSGDMPGMDHGSGDMPNVSQSPTSSGDMPGMDHGSGDLPGESLEHGNTEGTAPDRPLTPVLGTFGVATSAVLFTAGSLRRRDRARSRAREATRAARRIQT
jgi:uncharacterized protein involved in copper resistance